MPSCGKFQLGREIAYSDDTALYAAVGGDAPASAVVKLWRVFDQESASAVIQGIEAQRLASEAGCRGVLQVFDRGLDETGSPYCVTPICALSVRRMIEAQNRISSHHLERVMQATLEALQELAEKTGRPHGNLSLGNILLSHADPSAKGFRIYLGDLAAKGSEGNFGDDLYRLGRIIYQMVRRTERVPPHLNPPLEKTSEWDYLGKDAGSWLQVCNQLLSAGPHSGPGALAEALATVVDLDELEDRNRAPDAFGVGRWLKLAAAVLLAGGAAGGWLFWSHQSPRPLPLHVSDGEFSGLVEKEWADTPLVERLRGVKAGADGNRTAEAINNTLNGWVNEQFSRFPDLLTTSASEQLHQEFVENVSVLAEPNRDFASLPKRLESLRQMFAHLSQVVDKREAVRSAEGSILKRPDRESFEFIHGWVESQIAPGNSLEQIEARLDRARFALEEFLRFLQKEWPETRKGEFFTEARSTPRSFLGEEAVANWLGLARTFGPPREPVPLPEPVQTTTSTRGGTAPTADMTVAPTPPNDPKEAVRHRLREFLQTLVQQTGRPGFTLAEARRAQQSFESLRVVALQEIQDEPPVRALQAAFQALPAEAPQLAFTLPTLEGKGWRLERSGPDFVVYWRTNLTPPIRVPFHRVQAADGTAFAVSAIEIPLLYAANSGGWTPRTAPEGPSAWIVRSGRVELNSSWAWPSLTAAQKFLDQREDLPGDKRLYSNDVPKQPSWSTPVCGITGLEAAAIARALGGALPTLQQYSQIENLVRRNGWDIAPHMVGSAFNAQKARIGDLGTRLGATSWKRFGFDTVPGGGVVWPYSGSYDPDKRQTSASPAGAGDALWFLPADRASIAAPEKIHDFLGNVAEWVDGGEQRMFVAGGSALSASSKALQKPATIAYTDVGIRMVAQVATSNSDNPLITFQSAVSSIAIP